MLDVPLAGGKKHFVWVFDLALLAFVLLGVTRLARLMQRNPGLGILQTLVVGLPAASPFARMFQFGMRHAMRSYTMGSAWWMADCGPYWGHNAFIRVRPFTQHCELPMLPGKAPLGGWVARRRGRRTSPATAAESTKAIHL